MLDCARRMVTVASLLLFAIPAFAQNCALCYTQAASSGTRFIGALRSGIIVLIVPPMFMSAGITWLAYRKRNQFRIDADEDDNPDQDNLGEENPDEDWKNLGE
jgi:hypothetical protein